MTLLIGPLIRQRGASVAGQSGFSSLAGLLTMLTFASEKVHVSVLSDLLLD